MTRAKWIGKGIVTCRMKRWLLEGDGCVATRRSTGCLVLTISMVNGQEWQLRFVRHEGPGHTTYKVDHWIRWRYRLRVSGIYNNGEEEGEDERHLWAEASHSTGGYGFLQKKWSRGSSFQDVHASVDPKSTRMAEVDLEMCCIRSPRCRTYKLGRQPFLETGN